VTNALEVGYEAALWLVVVTYRRPDSLRALLVRLAEQSRQPNAVVVVDNDDDPAIRRIVEDRGATYLASPTNEGPAGGIARGMAWVLERASDPDWIMLLDDDDPPSGSDTIQALLSFALVQHAADSRTAGVGLSGARWDVHRARTRRLADTELAGTVEVDLIGGNQLPTYRVGAVRSVGTFNPGYFFGFDDAEYGLRLRQTGHRLYVEGDGWRRRRQDAGRLGTLDAHNRHNAHASAWRRYYTARNLAVLARRHGTAGAVVSVVLRSGVGGAARLAADRRPIREVVLPLRGLVDAARGRMGRTVDPGNNAKVV
jgi:rhamnopyranosyl-N-acetylglucosaminyl-diphospho-decaprenol beta-1,3/1,4-galactofuranosyltransferase